MDIIDCAQKAEEQARRAALSQAGAPCGPGPEMIDGVPHCCECGMVIPSARLAAVPGCGRCVQCQVEADER